MVLVSVGALLVGLFLGYIVMPDKVKGFNMLPPALALSLLFIGVPIVLNGLGLGGVPVAGQLLSSLAQLIFAGALVAAGVKLLTS